MAIFLSFDKQQKTKKLHENGRKEVPLQTNNELE